MNDPEPMNRLLAQVRDLPGDLHNHVILSMQDQVTGALWEQSKIIYLLDEAMWAALASTEPSGPIPGDVFRRLPHPDPYVAFPTPYSTTAANGDVILVDGMWVGGKATSPDGDYLTSTADPNITGIVLLFNGYVADPRTGQRTTCSIVDAKGTARATYDAVLSRSTVLITDSTLEDHIHGVLARAGQTNARSSAALAAMTLPENSVSELMRRAVITLVYLCSDSNDIVRETPGVNTRKDRRREKRQDSAITVYEVGYRIGAALRRHREATTTAGEPTGRTVRGHLRAAHFHTYRVGEGRRDSIVRWLSPIPVKLNEPPAEPTVRKVR
jgi:hypothetical protein